MSRALPRVVPALLSLVFVLSCGTDAVDLVLHNGAVYTVDADRSWAEAVVVKDGEIAFVGSSADALAKKGAGMTAIDLEGKMVLPGFHESHYHPTHSLWFDEFVPLHAARSRADLVRMMQASEGSQSGDWKLGFGFRPAHVRDIGEATKEELDRAFPDIPVAMVSIQFSQIWVNSRALEVSGITAATEDTVDSSMSRDPKTGEPTGLLHDHAFLWLDIPLPSAWRNLRLLRKQIEKLNAHGFTAFMDAYIDAEATIWGFRALDMLGWLTAHAALAQPADPALTDDEQVARFREASEKHSKGHVRANMVKFFLDVGDPLLVEERLYGEDTESEIWKPERYRALVARLDRAGLAAHTHVLGDGATRIALDAIEYARAADPAQPDRHTLTHLYWVDPADLPRFRQLEATANISAIWGYPESAGGMEENPEALELIGRERFDNVLPFGWLERAGARLTSGSDYPYAPLSPFAGIEVGITRKHPTATDAIASPGAKEQSTSLEALIASYTINGAYQLYQDDVTGSLEAGKKADLIVIDRNLFEIAVEDISETQVLLTLFEGRPVYVGESFRVDLQP